MTPEADGPARPQQPSAGHAVPRKAVQVVALVLILIALDATTSPRFGNIVVVVVGAIGLVGVWRGWFPAARRRWETLGRGARLAWIVVPTLAALALYGILTGAVERARFELSRAAMDQLVAEALAGRRAFPDHVGLYDVESVESRPPDEVRVVVGHTFLDTVGFTWFADATMTKARADETCGCSHQSLGGGWWSFLEDG